MDSIKCSLYEAGGYREYTINRDDVIMYLQHDKININIKKIKIIRGIFQVDCDGFKIWVPPQRVAGWKKTATKFNYFSGDNREIRFFISDIETAKLLISDGRDISIRANETVIQQKHVKVVCSRYSIKLYVKSQDGKWIMEKQTYGGVHGKPIYKTVEEVLKIGLQRPAPFTKAEILKRGTPDPHIFDTDNRIIEEKHGRMCIRSGLLKSVKISKIVTINPNRTVKDASDPDGEGAWFQIDCETNIRGYHFTVISNGEYYHIMTKIGSRRKIVESTKINSYLDANDMTKIDQRIVKEAIEVYAEKLIDDK